RLQLRTRAIRRSVRASSAGAPIGEAQQVADSDHRGGNVRTGCPPGATTVGARPGGLGGSAGFDGRVFRLSTRLLMGDRGDGPLGALNQLWIFCVPAL